MMKITIPVKMPSANWLFLKQRNKWVKNEEKQVLQQTFAYYMNALRTLKAKKGERYVFDIYMKNKKTDPDNYGYSCTKVFFDTAQKIGFIKNDNIVYISGIELNFFVDKKDPRIEIFFDVDKSQQ